MFIVKTVKIRGDGEVVQGGQPIATIIPLNGIDLSSQLQKTSTFFTANANEKNLALLLDVDPSLPRYVEVDPMRLRQILGNLISNAIKFTSSGEIVVSSRFQPDMPTDRVKRGTIEISVSDSVIGMTEAEMSHLFERFSQANSGTTGLCLSICKQLSTGRSGSIRVSSVRGKGSTLAAILSAIEQWLSTPGHGPWDGIFLTSC